MESNEMIEKKVQVTLKEGRRKKEKRRNEHRHKTPQPSINKPNLVIYKIY